MSTTALTTAPPPAPQILYFAYGSNLARGQMRARCPASPPLGLARLRGWRWVVSERGYANVVELPAATAAAAAHYAAALEPVGPPAAAAAAVGGGAAWQAVVWGAVYGLGEGDEASLDGYEGVPWAYTKERVEVEVWWGGEGGRVDVGAEPERRECLVYVDRKRVGEGVPKEEYVGRMNAAVKDALMLGVPREYVDEVIRRFVPDDEGKGVAGIGGES